jgi:hypothetical protein
LFFLDILGVERLSISSEFKLIEDFLDVVVLFELFSSLEVMEVISVFLRVKFVIFIDKLRVFIDVLIILVSVVFKSDIFLFVENFIADRIVYKQVEERSRNLKFQSIHLAEEVGSMVKVAIFKEKLYEADIGGFR